MKKEEDEFYNINTVQLIDTAKNDKESIEKIIKEWEKLIREVCFFLITNIALFNNKIV